MAESDVFLSHNWGADNRNHSCVSIINEKLKEYGYTTWFDGDKMHGDIIRSMVDGIDNTKIVLVFLTQKYIDKVNNAINTNDNCQREFNYALSRKTSSKMIPVLMESQLSTGSWIGSVGMHLWTRVYINMSGDLTDKEYLNAQMELLDTEIKKLGIQPTNYPELYQATSYITPNAEESSQPRRVNNPVQLNQRKKTITVLILGEVGVGKSTWINAIVNYHKHKTLEQAMQEETLAVTMPFRFIYTNLDGESKYITYEDNKNECVNDFGVSSYLFPREYYFETETTEYVLIDTPGIGDTRGIQKDAENCENILEFLLCNYEQIHAVIVLVKPNVFRLTVAFRFFLLKLLTKLHKSVVGNIIFAFTNSRATFYRPGDSFPVLKKFLKDHDIEIPLKPPRYFCFDNEAFRFLACVKKGITFEEDEIRLYSQSWDQAYKTTHKLFEAVKNFVPHSIRETISFNEARNYILALSKPMGEAIKLIDMNLKRIAEIKDVCDNCDINIAEFQKALKFKGFESRKEFIDHPKTVCTDSDCIRRVAIGQSSVTDTMYVTECHDHGYLEGIPIEITNNLGLASCATRNSGTCRNCGHSYKIHMHVTYIVHIEEIEYLSSETQAKIKDKRSLKEQQRLFIRELEKTSKEQQAEKEQIYQSAVRFGVFLKKNAMVAINDWFDDYMHMLIYDESSKERRFRDENKIKKLEQDRETYLQKKKLLEETINDGLACEDDIIAPEKIIEIRNNLKKLKHNGKHFERLAAVDIGKERLLANSRRKPQRIRSSSCQQMKSWLKLKNWYHD